MNGIEQLVTGRSLDREPPEWENLVLAFYERAGIPVEIVLEEALRLSYRITVEWVESLVLANGDALSVQEKIIIRSLLNRGKSPKDVATHIMACRRKFDQN